jgi:hypothetical protein
MPAGAGWQDEVPRLSATNPAALEQLQRSTRRKPSGARQIDPDIEDPSTFEQPTLSSLTSFFGTGSTVEAHATNLVPVKTLSASRLAERPVFVAERGWRRLLIRATIVFGAGLLAAWLIALVAGALGWGNLPGLPFSAGGDHRQSGASIGRPSEARLAAAQPRPLSVANRATGPSAVSMRASSRPPAAAMGRPPGGALPTPKTMGARPQAPVRSSSPPAAWSGAPPEAGAQRESGSTGGSSGTASTGTPPGNGPGVEPGHSGSPPSHESGPPAVTSSGNVPAEDAHGGNPSALAYGQGGNPTH